MAAVYQARDERDGSECAVKILARMRPTWVQRFAREFESARRVNHENVVRVLEAGDEEGLAYFSMEQIQGVTAARYVLQLEADDPLPPPAPDRVGQSPVPIDPEILQRTLSVAVQLAAAVGAIHGVGLVHRDLKPGNVLVTTDGVVKLVDFGVAKWLQEQSSFTQEGHVVGSYSYMSPEQITGGQVDHRADQYGMGILLYELLSGSPPFRARRPQEYLWLHCTEQPQPLSRRLDGVPSSLDRLLLRLLAKEPADRPPSMAAVERELRAIQETVNIVISGQHAQLVLETTAPGDVQEEETTQRHSGDELGRMHRSFKKAAKTTPKDSSGPAQVSVKEEGSTTRIGPTEDGDDSTEKLLVEVKRPSRDSAPPSAASLAALVTPRYTGREDELDEIMRHLKATRRKGIRAVLLEGEAGIGKTRMLQTFRGLAWVKGARVAIGRCHGSGGAFCAPFHDIMLRLAGPGLSRSHNDRILDNDREILQRFFPALAPRDQPPTTAPLRNERATDQNQAEFYRAVCGAVRRASTEAPLVIGLEDVQWADPGTIELVKAMLLRLTPPKAAQVLLVLTYRGEDVVSNASEPLLVPTIEGLSNVHSLALTPLSDSDMEEVIRSVTINVPVDAHTINQLSRAARGNPRFAVEVARTLVVKGGSSSGGDWKLPTSLLDAYRHRLDTLDKTSRDVARCIALLGGTPPLSIIQRATSLSEEHFTEAIGELEQRKVINVDHTGDLDRLELRSEALRTVVLDSLSASQAKALHRRSAAAWLKATGPRAESSAQAARHLYAAGEDRAAFPHALEAAYHSGESLDYASVRRWMAQIGEPGEALEQVSPDAVYRFQMLRFLLAFGDGDLERAQSAVSLAANAASDLRSQLLTGIACSRIHTRTGNYVAAVQVCRRGLREAKRATLHDLAVTFANLGARAARRSGDNQSALSWLAEADILVTTDASLKSLAIDVAWSRSAVLLELHREDEAETEIHRAIHLAKRDQQDRILSGLRLNLGLLLWRRGEIPEAISEFKASRKISAETGEYEVVAQNDVCLARLELMRGKVGEAVELARSAWGTFRRLHDQQGIIVSGAALLAAARVTQDEPDAQSVIRSATKATPKSHSTNSVWSEHWVECCRWHVSREERDEAKRCLKLATDSLGDSPPRYRKHQVQLLESEFAYHREEYDEAQRLSAQVVVEAREAQHWPTMWRAEAQRAAARAAKGEEVSPPEPPQTLIDNDLPLAFYCAWFRAATLISLGEAQEAQGVLREARESARTAGFVDWTNRLVARIEELESV